MEEPMAALRLRKLATVAVASATALALVAGCGGSDVTEGATGYDSSTAQTGTGVVEPGVATGDTSAGVPAAGGAGAGTGATAPRAPGANAGAPAAGTTA